ncbi:retrovirus Pol polyprotein [Trichuris trichiura]|uniref:Retrovirus Pol polyprotein n=1 Tax=Trichuris trichiura TaxID=36087 RepID=A0A077Z624_TRITR|nr:retrovirus Pol polyprotein [Trichuris trichiura]
MELESGLVQLNGENYLRWKFEIEAVLEARDCSDLVSGEALCPAVGDEKVKAWKNRDAIAWSIVSRSLDDFHHSFVRSCKTFKEMMDTIIKIREQTTVGNKFPVYSEFHAYTKNVASFIAGLNAIVNKMQSLNIVLDDATIIGKAVKSLAPEFDYFRQPVCTEVCETFRFDVSVACRFRLNKTSQFVEESKKRVQAQKYVVCWNCKKKDHIQRECRNKRCMVTVALNLENERPTPGGFVIRTNLELRQERNDGWIVDSGAFKHITRNRHWFSTFKEIDPCGVRVGGDKLVYAVGVGTIDVEMYNGKTWVLSTLNGVLYVPEFRSSCLFTLGGAAARGYKLKIEGERVCLAKDGKTDLVGYKDSDLYTLLIRRSSQPLLSAMAVAAAATALELWHQRRTHVSIDKIKAMNEQNFVDGLQITGEQNREEVIKRRKCLPGEILHTDVCGPIVQPSVGGSFYFFCFKGESSGYRKVCFMRREDDVLKYLKSAISEVKRDNNRRTVRRLRSDCGTEFVKKIISDFLVENGTRHEKSPPSTPECNYMGEREDGTLVEKTRSMLCVRNLPKRL